MQTTSLHKYFFPFFSILFALTLQVQGTTSFGDRIINLAASDVVFIIFLITTMFKHRNKLFQSVLFFPKDKTLCLSILGCIIFFTFSFFKGSMNMWPLIKYLGFFILLGYLFLGYFLDEKKSRPKTSKAFILSLNGSSILFFLATLAKSFQWIDFPEVAVQNFGLSGNPNVFGLISCFTLALHLSLIDRGNLPFAKNLNSLLIILEMITILTTASRASWISGIIIFIYFLFKKNTWKALSIPLLFFICFFSAYHYYL